MAITGTTTHTPMNSARRRHAVKHWLATSTPNATIEMTMRYAHLAPEARERVTDLARLLLAARREFLAAEGQFLDGHEFDRELAERRGVAGVDDEG